MTRRSSIPFFCFLLLITEATVSACRIDRDVHVRIICSWLYLFLYFQVLIYYYCEYFAQYGLNFANFSDSYYSTEQNLVWSNYSTAMSVPCSRFRQLQWGLGNSIENNCLDALVFSEAFNITINDAYELIQDYRDLNFLCTYGSHCRWYSCSIQASIK